ncbi:TPA: peptidase M66 [Yersinia enterocolitica]|nr:peptidase M66 [Yersinia enterocolitica]
MSGTYKSVFFNSQSLFNDLEGEFEGSVLITQSTVLPSRASTLPDDIQPRMVSYRDAMVMFKPLTTSEDFDKGIVLNVIGKDSSIIFSTPLKTPEQLPEPAEQIHADEAEFIEPASYDHVIKSQSEFNKMTDDVSGSYLSTLLETSSSIKIITSDGNFLKDIYLPCNISSQDGKLITFEREASYSSTIFYANKTIEASRGDKLYFKNVSGVWNMPFDLPYSEVESVFTDPGKYDYVINSQSEINETGNDPDSQHLNSLFLDYSTINIRLADGQWAAKFYLPENDSSLNGKKVIFYSNAGYSSSVYYSDQSLSLHRGQTLVFINNDGVWAEWSDSQYAKISYGQNFWSGMIPWQHILPGVSFQFQAGALTGVYTSPNIGAPGELLIHTVDIGMLTPNRQEFSFQYDDDYHRQYFQQIPASRLIINEYEPVFWQEIMLPDGTLYTDHSSDEGGIYDGDLRQRIGKELISLGINNANYGIFSSPGTGEGGLNNHYKAAQLTAHNSVGNYINGRVVHGLSGGAGMVTLESSVGNEFSHEVGHNYGLGHYPNGFDGSIHRSAENINSTWGWDSNKNVFIPNFAKAQSGDSACYDGECQPPFDGHQFGADAMAGGAPLYSSTNAYTLYTPYSHHEIQKFLEGQIVFDKNSSTGATKWNEETKSMEEWAEFYGVQPNQTDADSMATLLGKYILVEVSQWDGHYSKDIYIPQASSMNKSRGVKIVHDATYNSTIYVNGEAVVVSRGSVLNYESDGSSWNLVADYSFNVVRTPQEQGVSVTTILGYYDPDNILPSYVYSALHGAYGNIFNSDSDIEVNDAKCYAEVMNDKGQTLKFVLRSERADASSMNRIHINVASSFSPTNITIYSEGSVIVAKPIQPPTKELHFIIYGRSQ